MGPKSEKTIGHEFLKWLSNEKKLKNRSARDVLSHLSRAKQIIDINQPDLDGEDLAFRMSKSKEFHLLSPSVKSHLRRSVRLYKEFLNYYIQKTNRKLF